jgi:hypothetical protein
MAAMNRSRFVVAALLALVISGDDSATNSDAADSHKQMVALLDQIQARTLSENIYLGDGRLKSLRATLARVPAAIAANPPPGPAAGQLCTLLYELGQAELLFGNERKAIGHLSKAYELLPKAGKLPPERRGQVMFDLGMAYLRLAETENCCQLNNPDSCILPIQGGGVHTKLEGSSKAAEWFTQTLMATTQGSETYMKALWLLNLAHMTLGSYPDRVPRSYRIPPSAYVSQEKIPRFPNIARKVGVATFSLLGGAVAEDFDGDGNLDLMVSTWDPAGQVQLFRNDGSGSFVNRTKESGLIGIRGGINMVQADYDNDGDIDVLVLRGAWFFKGGLHPNSLLRNEGSGKFVDATFKAGLAGARLPTQTGAWADYDNDGDLDLFIGNETTVDVKAPCNLFRNNGDGTFVDVAVTAGVTNDRFTKAAVWGDFDSDRYPDLFLSNYKGDNRLYHNQRDGTFVDVAAEKAVTQPKDSFPAWFWDFDNDGNLDLFAFAYAGRVHDVCASYLDGSVNVEPARLYRGDGEGHFQDVARMANLTRPTLPMGSNFGDLDNDGFVDFYLGTGWPMLDELMPSVMYRNQNGRRFADVTTAGGFGNLQKGHAVVFADFDNDGDQDVFEQMGGAYPVDRYFDCLYLNPGFGNHWIGVQLVGVTSNRCAIGARIQVDITENGKMRSVFKHVNSGGSFGANPLRQTIGLGKAERIERIEVLWPTSATTQEFRGIEMDRYVRIVEGKDGAETLDLKQFQLGK